jgi:hypothetical protein
MAAIGPSMLDSPASALTFSSGKARNDAVGMCVGVLNMLLVGHPCTIRSSKLAAVCVRPNVQPLTLKERARHCHIASCHPLSQIRQAWPANKPVFTYFQKD